MFCVQCEQTIRTPAGNGCSYAQGMCGKTAETSDLQDLLIAALQGLSAWAIKAREYGIISHDVDNFAPRAFFSTLTNVNFDSPRIVGYAREAIALREALKAQCLAVDANATVDNPMADLQLASDDLRAVPQNYGVAGYLAFRHERSAGVLNGNRPDELQSDEHSGRG